nr:hypothetical protein [Tanacetum cinerariifolium]
MHPNRGRIEAVDADEDITLSDAETQSELVAELQGRLERKDEVNTTVKKVNAAKPTVFNNEEVRPIFEREYNKVQTLFIPDKDVEEPSKKRVAKETLLQESFKKLRAEVEVSGSHSTQEETPIVDPKEMSKEDVQNMLQIVQVAELKVEALQVNWNRPTFYNDGEDDDEDYVIAITLDFLITDSLIMGVEHLDTIPEKESDEFIKSRIDEANCDPEEDIHLVERLFDSLMEEIDLPFTLNDPMPSGIKDDDYDFERDILIREELLDNYSLSYHFDIPSFSRPPVKPPDEKSPDLLSHQGLKAFQPSAECPMMIYGKNTPVLDVPLFHFYPP